MNKARFEAFSDGVFAFAATLLILGIALPHFEHPVTESELFGAVIHQWPSLLAYLMGFGIIGVMWQHHHALFRIVDRIDRRTIIYNLALLGITAFIPFATAMLGTYPTMRTSSVLYGLTLTASASMYNVIAHHLIVSQAFSKEVDHETILQTARSYRFGWLAYSVSALVALASPVASFALYLLIGLYFFIPYGIDNDLAVKS